MKRHARVHRALDVDHEQQYEIIHVSGHFLALKIFNDVTSFIISTKLNIQIVA